MLPIYKFSCLSLSHPIVHISQILSQTFWETLKHCNGHRQQLWDASMQWSLTCETEFQTPLCTQESSALQLGSMCVFLTKHPSCVSPSVSGGVITIFSLIIKFIKCIPPKKILLVKKKCPYDIHDKGVEVCQYIVKTYLKDKRNTYKLNLSQ